MNDRRHPRPLAARVAGPAALIAFATAVVAISAVVGLSLPGTGALFSNQQPAAAEIQAGRIFRGQRDTPAFAVTDVSSGSASDGSSGLAFAGDGRWFTTIAWPVAFDPGRYIELDLSGPLPAGLGASGGQLSLRFAGDSGGASSCVYVELRRISTGALLSSHGSSGSPLGCSSGTTFAALSPPLSAVSTTDIANDLRVRIYGRDTGAIGPMRLDEVIVSGSTPYSAFTIYPILSRDVYDGQSDLIRWVLAGS